MYKEQIDEFLIIGYDNRKKGYVVINTKGEYGNHAHLRNLGACRKAIELVKAKKIPRKASTYFKRCCIRLSIDLEYRKKIEELIKVKQNKGKQRYYNRKPR
ncbi:MAG: hypothetical protein H0Z24_06800 [Thermosipho sp. (in: Bacteria)]|nr:hypothetical protein [Thermosipho sp. (in: thermotogales)]